MTGMDPFESRFTKVASLPELPVETPRVFRAAGGMVVLRRRQDGTVEAVDGSCFNDDQSIPSAVRLQRILDCVAAGAGSFSAEWDDLARRAGRPVRVDGNDVWVCLEQC